MQSQTNSYATREYSASSNIVSETTFASNLGNGWYLDGDKLMPVMTTSTTTTSEADLAMYLIYGWTKDGTTIVPATTTVAEHTFANVTKPTLPDFYHASNGKIDAELLTTTRQSSVLLAWNTDGNSIDYFTVMRRVQGEGKHTGRVEGYVRFDGGEVFVQNFELQKGWNWVSFNLKSDQLSDVNKLLGGMKWSDGDILTDLGSDLTMTYEAAGKQWIASGSTAGVTISPKKAYAIKVKEDCKFPIGGTVIKDQDNRTITVSKGWNAIGYTPITNLSVETALSDYFDSAEPGDMIKSHTEFAYFAKTGNTGRWRGSLQYMKPGKGYMMLRKGAADATFTYPFFDLNSNFREDWTTSTKRAAAAKARSTMTVSAVVEGFEVEDGDKLIAFANGEVVGSVECRV